MIFTIYPYYDEETYDTWVFDDERVGLISEALIKGTDQMINRMTANIANAKTGFELSFADYAFDGYQLRLDWLREGDLDEGGHWYYAPSLDLEGWLCPTLLLYYLKAPKTIFVSVSEV